MSPTDMILDYLTDSGRRTQAEIVTALGLAENTARNCIVGLVRRGMVRKVGTQPTGGQGGLCAVWEAVEDEAPKVDAGQVVRVALAKRSPLELAWAA